MKNDFTRELYAAIFAGKIPDAANQWPRVQVLITNPIVGSGESATWRTSATVRLNGKQIWRGGPGAFDNEKPHLKLGELIEFARVKGSVLYVIKPASLCPPANQASPPRNTPHRVRTRGNREPLPAWLATGRDYRHEIKRQAHGLHAGTIRPV